MHLLVNYCRLPLPTYGQLRKSVTVFMDAELDAILDVGGEPPATREAFAQRLLTRPRARACESRFESL